MEVECALTHQVLRRVIATVVLNGETLQTAQGAATYPNNTNMPDTGRYEKTGLERTQSV